MPKPLDRGLLLVELEALLTVNPKPHHLLAHPGQAGEDQHPLFRRSKYVSVVLSV